MGVYLPTRHILLQQRYQNTVAHLTVIDPMVLARMQHVAGMEPPHRPRMRSTLTPPSLDHFPKAANACTRPISDPQIIITPDPSAMKRLRIAIGLIGIAYMSR